MNLEQKYLRRKSAVALQILPLLGVIIVLKFILHCLEWRALPFDIEARTVLGISIFYHTGFLCRALYDFLD